MKKVLLILIAGLLSVGVTAYSAELNPLTTERAETIGAGKLRLDIGFSAESLPDSSLLLHTPGFGLRWGLSEDTDFILKYGGLMVREWPDDSESSGSGDLTFGLQVSPWKGPWGRLGFSIATKLPNADDTYGLGTDEQDFFLTGLYTANIKKLKINLNAGLAVVGDNEQLRGYDYLLTYGVGFEYLITDHWSIVGDVAGTTGGQEKNDIAEATLGVVGPLAYGWEWALTGSYGLTPQTPEWSAGLFLSHVWEVGPTGPLSFYTDESPLRLSYYPFPMETMESWTTKKNTVYTALGFSAAGFDEGTMLYNVFAKDIRVGVADGVDIGFSGGYYILEDSPIFDDGDGYSELHMSFKISPWQVGIFRFGFMSDVKLTTDNFHEGVDSGKMDFTGLALASLSYKRLAAHVNLGLAIEGQSNFYSSQNDLLVVGLGAEYALTDWMTAYAEFSGKFGEESDSSYMAGGGFRFLVGKCVLFVSGQAGFGEPDPDWVVTVGLMRLWNF
jgi:hypothetical protein